MARLAARFGRSARFAPINFTKPQFRDLKATESILRPCFASQGKRMPWFQALSSGFAPCVLAFLPVSGREAEGRAKVKEVEQPGRGGGAVANISDTGDAREALDGMPAEVDFSESLPNPYVGKVRRRVDATTDNGSHGQGSPHAAVSSPSK